MAVRPEWMNFDDEWVEEVRRGFLACKVFCWFPIYCKFDDLITRVVVLTNSGLAYGQMTNNLTSMAATMELNGVPNDVVANFNPISILLIGPLMNILVYPALRKSRINFSPIKRIAVGFALAAFAMVASCVTQAYVYRLGPCGTNASKCEDSDGNSLYAPISVWIQLVPYGLIGFSDVLGSVTALEYAFTKAPENMRSTV